MLFQNKKVKCKNNIIPKNNLKTWVLLWINSSGSLSEFVHSGYFGNRIGVTGFRRTNILVLYILLL
jgi:hypothetical protein